MAVVEQARASPEVIGPNRVNRTGYQNVQRSLLMHAWPGYPETIRYSATQ